MQVKTTAMKKSVYNKHYKAFVKELSLNPDQTLQSYCRENGIVWRRLYGWMRRNQISLKKLYQTCRVKSGDVVCAADKPESVEFREVIPGHPMVRQPRACTDSNVITGVSVRLPSGITISLEECNVSVLFRLISGLAGKEVGDVLS